MWLNVRTGYSFKSVFGHLDEVLNKCKGFAGIADFNSTYGHVRWYEECKKVGIEPIFGVSLPVSDLHPKGSRTKRYQNCEMTFIAINQKGLTELYNLVDLAHKQFYQFPKITYKQLNKTSENLIVLSGISPELEKIKRKVYLQLSPNLPKALIDCGLEPVACLDNYYPDKMDKIAYESFTAHQWTMERKTTPQHILTDEEWLELFPKHKSALNLRNILAKKAGGVKLPKAPMVKYDTENANDYLKLLCKIGAKKRGLKLNHVYKARLKKELSVIKEKGFADYFLVVNDLLEHCKKSMPVGPGRGSAAGSLVCYLLAITEIDPLKYGLLFERFIDINRSDWPDIDFDIKDQDTAIRYLQKIYGSNCVAQMANVNKLQPKSAIIRAAKSLNIPSWELEEFKESIEDRPEGDERARKAIQDSFSFSAIGRQTLDKFPNLYHVESLEGHPSHVGVHAAGVIVCPRPLNRFCGINSRTSKHVAMIDKRDAEKLNLLKIDVLGLTTLSILSEVCDQLGMKYSEMYNITLDNKKAYKLINSGNLPGIFQMEGSALRELASGMKAENIEDLAALSALCRPGPLTSGAAYRYVQQRSGEKPVKYISKHPSFKAWTKETMGNIVYQEQIMGIVKEMGGLSWEDVTKVRKLMGKSQGDEAFSKYKKDFIEGAIANGIKKKEASEVWEEMKNFGKYGFNKSHAIAYAVITYLTAYFKANHPLEFAVGLLNNTGNNLTALKILRDLKERSGIKYDWFSREAKAKWSVKNGVLLAGFETIEGIGPSHANTIEKSNGLWETLPTGIKNKLASPFSPFKYLYPGEQVYGNLYKKKSPYGKATHIKDIKEKGEYVFIGMLTKRTIKDLNDSKTVSKRGGDLVHGPSNYVSMVLEDDTGAIDVSIGRFQFEEIGGIVTDDTQLNKDWFVCYGKLPNNKYRRVYIENIRKITQVY